MKGRKPVSVAEKALKGTLQPCRINREAPAPEVISAPEAPPETEEERIYAQILKDAVPGHFRKGDETLLRTLCASIVRRDAIAAELAAWIAKPDKAPGETSLLVCGQKGALAPHPAYRLLSQYDRELRSLCSELGLSATSRGRVHATEEANLFADEGFGEYSPTASGLQ